MYVCMLYMPIYCRRKWQPTPVFLPEKFYGQKSLTGYHPVHGVAKELDKTEHLKQYMPGSMKHRLNQDYGKKY